MRPLGRVGVELSGIGLQNLLGRLVPKHLGEGLIGVGQPLAGHGPVDPFRNVLRDRLEPPVLLLNPFLRLPPSLQLAHDHLGQILQPGGLLVGNRPRGLPQHAQRPDPVAAWSLKRGARVEPDARRALHERMTREPLRLGHVLDHGRSA